MDLQIRCWGKVSKFVRESWKVAGEVIYNFSESQVQLDKITKKLPGTAELFLLFLDTGEHDLQKNTPEFGTGTKILKFWSMKKDFYNGLFNSPFQKHFLGLIFKAVCLIPGS